MVEVWKDIEGYEGRYKISNLGNVKSLMYGGRKYEKDLTPKVNNCGRLWVELFCNGKKKQFLIHRLVAKAFIPNPHGLPQINHIDENPKNNRVDNLEWCDARYNMMYGHAREKRRKKIVGRPHSEEHKKKISEGIKRHYAEKQSDWFCADGEKKE